MNSRRSRYKFIVYLIGVILIGYAFKLSWFALLVFVVSLLLTFILGRLILAYAKPGKTYFLLKPYLINLAQIVFLYTLLLLTVFHLQLIGFWWMLLLFGGYTWGKTVLQQFVFRKGIREAEEKYGIKPEIFDHAVFVDHEGQRFTGQLFLVKHTLLLYAGGKILTEIDTNAAEPELLRHRSFNFPIGFYCPHHDIDLYCDLPKFWMATITEDEQKRWIA